MTAIAFPSLPVALRQPVQAMVQAALRAADPRLALRRCLRFSGEQMSLQLPANQERRWQLSSYRHVYLVALGKAALPMTEALLPKIGRFLTRGLVITKEAGGVTLPKVDILEGEHPIPAEGSLRAGEQLRDFLQTMGDDDLLIFLLSGGGSALAILPPVTPAGIPSPSLDEIQAFYQMLLTCGATINEINTLRRHLDPLKGGGALRLCRADTLTLALSDVIGSAPEAIASGPTVPDPTTLADARQVIERYHLREALPPSILQALEVAPETLKPDDPLLQELRAGKPKHFYHLIGDNQKAAQAALHQARRQGFRALLLTTTLQGEAAQAGRFLAAILRQIAQSSDPLPRPACLIVGGETTVTVRGSGRGGRNQELALAAALDLAGVPDVALIALATDGQDGATDAAGAVVTGETVARAAARGLDARHFLENQDSYTFFSNLGDTLYLPRGRTNVNDLIFLFAW